MPNSNLSTLMPFGAYKSLEIGMVYFFDPEYLCWALGNTQQISFYDIDELMNLRIPDFYPKLGFDGYLTRANFEYFSDKGNFASFKFADLINSGYKTFKFNQELKERNRFLNGNVSRYRISTSLNNHSFSECPFYIGEEINPISTTISSCKFIGVGETSTGLVSSFKFSLNTLLNLSHPAFPICEDFVFAFLANNNGIWAKLVIDNDGNAEFAYNEGDIVKMYIKDGIPTFDLI